MGKREKGGWGGAEEREGGGERDWGNGNILNYEEQWKINIRKDKERSRVGKTGAKRDLGKRERRSKKENKRKGKRERRSKKENKRKGKRERRSKKENKRKGNRERRSKKENKRKGKRERRSKKENKRKGKRERRSKKENKRKGKRERRSKKENKRKGKRGIERTNKQRIKVHRIFREAIEPSNSSISDIQASNGEYNERVGCNCYYENALNI